MPTQAHRQSDRPEGSKVATSKSTEQHRAADHLGNSKFYANHAYLLLAAGLREDGRWPAAAGWPGNGFAAGLGAGPLAGRRATGGANRQQRRFWVGEAVRQIAL